MPSPVPDAAAARPAAMTAAPAIEAADATHLYSGGDGVAGLDLDIPTGTIFGFIGPSGAGKTTTGAGCSPGRCVPSRAACGCSAGPPCGSGPASGADSATCPSSPSSTPSCAC